MPQQATDEMFVHNNRLRNSRAYMKLQLTLRTLGEATWILTDSLIMYPNVNHSFMLALAAVRKSSAGQIWLHNSDTSWQ